MRLIDADAMCEWCGEPNPIKCSNCRAPQMETIEAEPVIHAQWEICEEPNTVDTYGNPEKYARCTHCGFRWSDVYSVKNYFKRCPECGAYMKGAEQQ